MKRVRVVCARDNERAFPVEREPTVYFSRAERSAGQHGTCNNTTYSGSQARRRQPQTKNVRGFQYNSKFFFVLTTCNHSSCILSFVVFLDLMWYCVHHFHGSFRFEFITGNWRVLDQKRIPESSSEVEVASGEHWPSREAACFLHINRVPTMSWLAWQGKRTPLYGWTIGTFFKCNRALFFFNSRLHCGHILYFENCKF